MKLILSSESVSKALALATEAHRGQVDKGGRDYVLHSVRVAENFDTEELQTAALLHDVVEDTPVTFEELRLAGFSGDVIDVVRHLTRFEGEPRESYLRRVSENSLAVRIKLADLAHNSDVGRIPSPGPADFARVQRYARETEFLRKFL